MAQYSKLAAYLIGATGLPRITSVITIQGNGATIKRASNAPNFRIIAVDPTGSLTLRQTRVSGGKLPDGNGGGLYNGGGTLSLIGCTISGNSAFDGGGVNSLEANFNATLTIKSSTISGNSATASGSFTGSGGGVSSFGELTVTNSTISGNSAQGPGGGMSLGGAATITNSTISGNSAKGQDAVAGGVANLAVLTLTNSTVTGNSAANGREVFNYSGNRPGIVIANDFNVFGFSGNAGVAGFTPGAIDIVPTVALAKILKTSLASNGGQTKTHALVSGSSAIDSVSDGTCPPPTKDQRGVKRPQDGNKDGGPACDTGSYELKR